MKAYDIIQHCGLPYVVTEVYETENPELFFKERYRAKCYVNNHEYEAANPYSQKNPHFKEDTWKL